MTEKQEDVKVKGTPLDADDRKLDNTPNKGDDPATAAVKAEDRKQEEIVETSTAAAEAAAENAADAAGPVKTEVKEGYGNSAEKPKATRPKLAKPAAEAQRKGVHIVVGDEQLNDIATKYGVGTSTLAKLNHLAVGTKALRPGQEIKLYPDEKDATQL